MDRDKIASVIQRVRTEHRLSQKEFGDKYYVTSQAVSKWERGLSLPDISILRQICEDFDEDMLELFGTSSKEKQKIKLRFILLGILCVFILFLGGYFVFHFSQDNEFQMKKLTTTCDNFTLYGSIAYDTKKTSVYISNISYCGEEDKNVYQKIECTLYENDGETKTKIQTVEEENVTLENFLKNVNFQFDHYSENCTMYENNGMVLEIYGTKKNGEVRFFEIPLELEC